MPYIQVSFPDSRWKEAEQKYPGKSFQDIKQLLKATALKAMLEEIEQ